MICRQRKIKCSGQKPCKTCVDAKRPSRCEYQSATPLRDDEYVRSLEERLRQLSSQVGREASQPAQPEEPNAANLLSASSYTFDVELPSVLEDSRQPSTSAAMIPSPPFTAASQEAPPNISRSTSVQNRNAPQPSQEFELAGVSASEGQYVTTLASPSVSNRHLGTVVHNVSLTLGRLTLGTGSAESGDSSARTLLHSVEAALQQLPHRQGLQSHQYNQSSLPTSPKLKPLQLPFVWQQSKAELYTLPQRHISDALVNVYRALNYPSGLG